MRRSIPARIKRLSQTTDDDETLQLPTVLLARRKSSIRKELPKQDMSVSNPLGLMKTRIKAQEKEEVKVGKRSGGIWKGCGGPTSI